MAGVGSVDPLDVFVETRLFVVRSVALGAFKFIARLVLYGGVSLHAFLA